MTQQNLISTYQKELESAKEQVKKIKSKINSIVLARILIFIGTILACYFTSSRIPISITTVIVGSLGFIYLVQVHAGFSSQKKYFTNKIKLNETELNALEGNFEELANGKEFLNPNHEYSYDIDLFGDGTFFQFFNRTSTDGGRIELANLLQKNETINILDKQSAIQELAPDLEWRQHFLATSSSIENEYTSEQVVDWISTYKNYIPKSLRLVLKVFPLLSIIVIILLSINLISTTVFVIWFFIGMLLTGRYLTQTNNVYQQANKAVDTINEYASLLTIIEEKDFKSSNNSKKKEAIKTEGTPASKVLNNLGKTLNRLNSRNNLIVAILGNSLFLWELNAVAKLEKWLDKNKTTVPKWFYSIYYFDAQISCANYSFNHQEYSFPTLNNSSTIIKAQELGHPLIKTNKRINNNILIKDNNFVIITGANMAGKSTFLRTISLNLILANAGMPVCAKSFDYRPIQLITSMRTSDSLKDEESYFFSELKRLKFIVDKIKTDTYFIILDEILKGTNSKDKEIGSKKFVQKLVSSGSTGIIATHDLALCTISDEYPQVINHYFDAEIIDNELHFDYCMKDGVCQNMNASFLLKKMEIV